MTALLSLLQNIQQQSEMLLDCLTQEKLALDNDQLERLNEISSQKQTLLAQLNQLDKQRSASSPDSKFNDFIANSNDQALINQWQATRKVIAECQKQNEINGRIIHKRSQLNKDILSILSGRSKLDCETYNAQGNQATSASLLGGIKA